MSDTPIERGPRSSDKAADRSPAGDPVVDDADSPGHSDDDLTIDMDWLNAVRAETSPLRREGDWVMKRRKVCDDDLDKIRKNLASARAILAGSHFREHERILGAVEKGRALEVSQDELLKEHQKLKKRSRAVKRKRDDIMTRYFQPMRASRADTISNRHFEHSGTQPMPAQRRVHFGPDSSDQPSENRSVNTGEVLDVSMQIPSHHVHSPTTTQPGGLTTRENQNEVQRTNGRSGAGVSKTESPPCCCSNG